MSRVALITGGQQGIGRGIALALSRAGYACVLASERAPEGPDVVSALTELGPTARYLKHDLSGTGAEAALVDAAEREAGPITTFVSNAGVPSRARVDVLETGVDSFDHVLSVNLRGAFFLAQEIARRMVKRRGDEPQSMIFVTSVSAEMVSVNRPDYCISKAGASMMARLFAARLARHGISVVELRPGIIATPMTDGVRDLYDARIADGLVPAGRWGTPEDIAKVVVPVAEGKMAFAQGAVLPIDGGLSLPRL